MNGRSLSRASYNYWIATSGAGTGPFTVQLTDTEGHQATLSGIQLEPGAVQQTSVRMYGSSAGTAGTTASPGHTKRRAELPVACQPCGQSCSGSPMRA